MYVIVGERVRHETMMWCALVFMAFVAAAQAGPTCVHCDKAREGESKCNTQFLAEGNSLLHCGNNEVCTTDVRCDGKGRVLWIKGCESKNGITAMNTNICNDDNTRCRHHCDGDMCNQFAPADLVPTLACTPPGCLLDLIFVADVSGSMPFDAVLAYMENTIPLFPPGKVRVGVVCFATDADTVLHLPQSVTPLDFIKQDHNVGSTMIALGIDEMKNEFLDHTFPDADRLGVVITDGSDHGPQGSIATSVSNALSAVTNLGLVAVKVNANDLSDISSVVIDIDEPQALVDMVDDLVNC